MSTPKLGALVLPIFDQAGEFLVLAALEAILHGERGSPTEAEQGEHDEDSETVKPRLVDHGRGLSQVDFCVLIDNEDP